MTTKQIIFRDTDDGYLHAGILCSEPTNGDTYIICGCCGGIVPLDEADIYKEYDEWFDLEDAIKRTEF